MFMIYLHTTFHNHSSNGSVFIANYIVQDLSWEAGSYSACQEIPFLLKNQKGSLSYSQKPATGPYPEPD